MSIEFISAKDLPTTEAEEVDVLCVEGGELKRKAGASLGGNTEYDLSIRLRSTGFEDGNLIIECELLSGSYDAVYEKITSGVAPKVIAIEDASNMGELTDGEDMPWLSVVDCVPALWVLGDESCISAWAYNFQWRIMPDNTIEAYWD